MTPKRFQKIKDVLKKRQSDLTVVLDNVHKPHNLAAIIRSCDAVGIGQIHAISKNKKIGLNLKAASGSNHWVKLQVHESIQSAILALKKQGFNIYAANHSKSSLDYLTIDYTQPSAVVLGAELDGISPKTRKLVCDEIHVNMLGMVQSLNVSVANAVILLEAQRQRIESGLYQEPSLDPRLFEKLLFEFCYPEVARVFESRGERYPELDDDGQIIN